MPDQHGSPGKKKNTKGKRLSVERIYQKKTQREHILLRPDAYIGSVESETKSMWIWDDKTQSIVMKEITFCPGLYKIFDEILVNAADNKQRDPSMNTIKITIDVDKNVISIWNNGRGIPIEMHKEQNVYVPTLIFGHLLTSSNYDDTQKKVTGGRNGFGAKLCNIYSTKFIVETACGENAKRFKQVWKGNMTKAEDAKIQDFRGTDFTCITFQPDLPKFHMEKLSDDMVALLKRRAYDIAGCSRGVTVLLNGEKLRVKSFKEYVDLYLKGMKKRDDDDDSQMPKVVHEICNNRWEVCVTVSENGFQQSSFVNSIATTKGGSHVNYLVDQIASKMMTTVKRKAGKELNIKAFQIKNHLWVFVNCLIENPTFDSQTKENMTLNQKSFGSKCELSEKFIKSVQSCGVLENIMNWVKFKTQEKLNAKCSGSKKTKLKGIAKLDDANDAGSAKSRDCTLILTEGDSAKTLAVSGIGIVGRDKYGVFPLRGKLLNVRDASSKQIMENAEVNNIVKIVGLQYKKKYKTVDDLKSLRYGRIMIMTDQDQDGSHIKGLLINFFHSNWPDILQLPFLEEFITPIVKVSKGNQSLSFFSLPELEEWKQKTNNIKSWKVKYYKGLGTSTSKEAKEYFTDMKRHRIKFNYDGPACDQAIKMAFSKKMVNNRKEWLSHGMHERKTRREMGMPEMYLYGKDTKAVTYSEFVNKELILFSNTDNERSIPSLVDGLKPGQRKVLFTCLKRNDKREIKVAQLAGSVAELSAYHHGEVSLMGTIINLAQNYLGSNNINLLQPIGQFGTRINGGKDSASPRYIFTMLSPLTRLIFPEQDDAILNYQQDDGVKIEPEWYCPILPMVLVNGAEGIGTGWSTKIPNYNPRELAENIKKIIAGESIEPMMPWYKNFTGSIDQVEPTKFISSGQFEVIDSNTLEISELPVKTWTSTYKENVLEPYLHGTDKIKSCITDYRDCSTDKTVKFTVVMEENELASAEQEGFAKRFKLESAINTSSMVLFDNAGVLKKYDDVESILKEFYEVRLKKYYERKDYLKGKLEAECSKLENQARFILEKIEGKISIENRSKRDVVAALVERSFLSDPVKTWKNSLLANKLDDDSETESVASSEETGPDFNYILNMNLWSLSREKKEELLALRDAKKDELFTLMKKSPEDLWIEDLDAFLLELDKVEEKEREEDMLMAQATSKAKSMNQRAMKKPKRNAPAKKEKTTKEKVVKDNNDITEMMKKNSNKNEEKKKTQESSSSNGSIVIEDDASSTTSSTMMSLAERLAAKKDPSSKVQSLLNFDISKKRKPTKKLTVPLSDDEDEDDIRDFTDDDEDDDFVPKKKKKTAKALDSEDDDYNSETEKTKELIKKLTPIKQKKGSSESSSDASTKPTTSKRNLLSDDLVIDDDKSSPPAKKETKKPAAKKQPAAKGRAKKATKDSNQLTLFAATKTKATDKKKSAFSVSSDDDDDYDVGKAEKGTTFKSRMKPKATKKVAPAAKPAPAKKAAKKKGSISSDEDEPVVAKKASKPSNPATKAKKPFSYDDDDEIEDSFDVEDQPEIPAKTDRIVRERKGKAKYRFDESDDDDDNNDDDHDDETINIDDDDDDDSDFSF